MQDTPEKKKIKRIYKELQGYLSQIPLPSSANEILTDNEQWEHINTIIDRLNVATENNYDEFKTIQKNDRDGWSIPIMISTVRAKLGSLINVLHEEYFSDEPPPLSGNQAGMVINNQNSQQQNNSQKQNQQQHQEQKIELDQMLQIAHEEIQAEYGKEQAEKAIDLIKQIVLNPKNWSIIAASIAGLLAIGKVAFIAALPILGKILLGAAPVLSA
jgi:hypothetical protein